MMKAVLSGMAGTLLVALAFLIGTQWQKGQTPQPFARYEMTTILAGTTVARLDRQTGTLHYSGPYWANDVPEKWSTTPTPAPTR